MKVILAIGLVLFAFPTFVQVHGSSNPPAGLLIPLYAYPTDSSWSNLISAKRSHPSLRIIAIVITSDDGPGTAVDPNFVNGIAKLRAAQITVIGYVATDYGADSISGVEAEMMTWRQFYGVNGIFFDNMAWQASTASYYKSLAKFASSHGFVLTVGNPGGAVDQSLVGIFQITCIWENPGMPTVPELTADKGPRSEFSYIASGVPQLPSNLMTQYVYWVFITNLNDFPLQYNALPSYLSQELNALI